MVTNTNSKSVQARFIEIVVKILDVGTANSVPGYYEIFAQWRNYTIKVLKSNVFYFMLGSQKIIGKSFKVRGRLIHLVRDKQQEEYILDLDSKWGIHNLSMRILENEA